VQVAWLGYPNTTGLSAMDYRITDVYADPVGMTERFHTEQLLRLPECFSCYQPPQACPDVGKLPAPEKGYLTFGSLNNLAKVNPAVIELWAGILRAVPHSRLMLKHWSSESALRESLCAAFASRGIVAERLDFVGIEPDHVAHLQRHHGMDIGLDPFPYNGATTTCDALWMGIPVITLAGATHVARVGVSQMSNLGLAELIARSPEEYLEIAVRLAGDTQRLSALRAGLRARMAASPLTDAPRFTRHLERTYREMWERWCAPH
jgi:predicted O-linked N-acetylglucosamine transferase (SPINDLY family)